MTQRIALRGTRSLPEAPHGNFVRKFNAKLEIEGVSKKTRVEYPIIAVFENKNFPSDGKTHNQTDHVLMDKRRH
jgi:hypothetical protein